MNTHGKANDCTIKAIHNRGKIQIPIGAFDLCDIAEIFRLGAKTVKSRCTKSSLCGARCLPSVRLCERFFRIKTVFKHNSSLGAHQAFDSTVQCLRLHDWLQYMRIGA